MRWLINYIRSCFCVHTWDISEKVIKVEYGGGDFKHGDKVFMLCKKCGYHKKFWKHL